jgi:hypothetical protein
VCKGCGLPRADQVTATVRTACPNCGETAIVHSRGFTAVVGSSGSLDVALRPAHQNRDWQARWRDIQSDWEELSKPSQEPLSAESIHRARQRLHAFYIQAYHLKDALKSEASRTRVPASVAWKLQ